MRLRGWLKEPLIHFLIGGAMLFAFFAWRGDVVDPESRTITITESQVAKLAANWTAIWRRQPSPQELDALIRDYVKEEVYAREGLRLGLDQDDPIIRRRIRSKMEYLATAQVENAGVDEAVLSAWYAKNSARYADDNRYSFDQIFIAANDADQAAVRAKAMLGQLAEGADWWGLGDTLSLPRSVIGKAQADIARDFGGAFASGLAGQPKGQWSGPIASGFGLHLVRIKAIEVDRVPPLSSVRQRVENDWRAETAKDREAKAYQALLDGYRITIDRP